MSRYSGKCDFYDVIEIHGEDWIFNKFKFYVRTKQGNKNIRFAEKRDMMPFYPHIVTAMASSKETGGTLWLSKYPFPYEEDLDYWKTMTSRFCGRLRYASDQARKTGEPLDINTVIDNFIRKYTFWHDDDPKLRAVCEQIATKTKPIKYPLRDTAKWYMTMLCEDLAAKGVDPVEWGYIIQDGKVADYDKKTAAKKIKSLII